MAKLKISRIEIASAVSDSEEIVNLLQRFGCMEISVPQEQSQCKQINCSEILTDIEKKLNVLNGAKSAAAKYYKNKGGLLGSLTERETIDDNKYEKIKNSGEDVYRAAERIISLSKKITDFRVEIVKLETQIDNLLPWADFDAPLDFSGTKNVSLLKGSAPKSLTREDILMAIAADAPEAECADAEIIYSGDAQTCFYVCCMRDQESAVEQVLRAIGFARLSETSKMTVKEKIRDLESSISEIKKDIKKYTEELSSLSRKSKDFDYLIDYYLIQKDKYEASEKICRSEKVAFMTGYIPEMYGKKVKNKIEDKFDAAVFVADPSEDEDVPVVLKNNGFSAPLESITEMYSLPGRNDIDPTAVMSFFYYFFFGMMLSDAGYGLIIVIATAVALLKFKMEKRMRNTLKMYFYCGLSTVFWGAMYGSWFGDIPNIIGENFLNTDKFASTAIWLDPISDLMKLLVYCFIFGLVHLFVGVGIKAVNLLKHKQPLEAFCESVPTFVTIFGLSPIFFGLFTTVPQWLSTIGTPVLIVGVILVVATAGRSSKSIGGKIGGGLYGLYNLVSGYLGDVLSYARLLALGLSTGVIAQVINMLCTLPESKALKIVMLIVVGTLGHIANLGINIIGAYVHTNRLQYVEFFSKFYEGGGRALNPLKINTKTYKFKEEN